MKTEAKTFRCEISTPDGPVLEGEFVSVNLPALDGYMGVLANRAPITAVITTGLITLDKEQGEPKELFVSRGFLRVHENEMTILAEECKPVAELNPEAAWEMLQRAYKMPSETDDQRKIRDEAIASGRIRFSLAQKARKGMMSLDEMMSRGLG